jgi:hypothetical protein
LAVRSIDDHSVETLSLDEARSAKCWRARARIRKKVALNVARV